MQLPDKAVKEFIEIFEKEYGKKLTFKEGKESAENLYKFFSILIDIDKRTKITKPQPKQKS